MRCVGIVFAGGLFAAMSHEALSRLMGFGPAYWVGMASVLVTILVSSYWMGKKCS